MLTATLLSLVLSAEPAWKKLDTSDGIGLSSRELEGERVVELRAITMTKASPLSLCAATRAMAVRTDLGDEVKMRKVIKNTPEELVKYEQVSAPIVSDRDYAIRMTFLPTPNGNCSVPFTTANDQAPPLPRGFVRMEKLRGTWAFEAAGNGETRVTYTILADPGGSIPASFVEGTRRETTTRYLRKVVKLAEANPVDAGAQPTP